MSAIQWSGFEGLKAAIQGCGVDGCLQGSGLEGLPCIQLYINGRFQDLLVHETTMPACVITSKYYTQNIVKYIKANMHCM